MAAILTSFHTAFESSACLLLPGHRVVFASFRDWLLFDTVADTPCRPRKACLLQPRRQETLLERPPIWTCQEWTGSLHGGTIVAILVKLSLSLCLFVVVAKTTKPETTRIPTKTATAAASAIDGQSVQRGYYLPSPTKEATVKQRHVAFDNPRGCNFHSGMFWPASILWMTVHRHSKQRRNRRIRELMMERKRLHELAKKKWPKQ